MPKPPSPPADCTAAFCPRHHADQRLNLVGRTFLEKEGQDDPYCFLGHGPINANIGDETIEQFIHGLALNRTHGGLPHSSLGPAGTQGAKADERSCSMVED